MTKKFSDLENDEKRNMEDQLETIASSLGMESWNAHGNGKKSYLEEAIGICYNCRNLLYCRTEFGNVFAKCEEYDIRLNGQNRIVECNSHSPIHTMTLQEMYSIAYLIDLDEKKIKGFTG